MPDFQGGCAPVQPPFYMDSIRIFIRFSFVLYIDWGSGSAFFCRSLRTDVDVITSIPSHTTVFHIKASVRLLITVHKESFYRDMAEYA